MKMQVKAFKPIIYSKNLDHFYSPPFDTISPDLEKKLKEYKYNITHITLPSSPQESLETIKRWKTEGILKTTGLDVLVLLKQEFTVKGKQMERVGMFCAIRIYPDSGDILPHEKTFSGPRKNRYTLMEHTDCQPEAIFLVTSSSDLKSVFESAISSRTEYFKFEEPAGVTNSVFIISDKIIEDQITGMLSDKVAIVADGHHRLAASKEIARTRAMKGRKGWKYIMTYLCPVENNDLLISGIHRIVTALKEKDKGMKKLGEFFEITDVDQFTESKDIMFYDGKYHSLKAKEGKIEEIGNLDPTLPPDVVNRVIFNECFGFNDEDIEKSVIYSHDMDECRNMVDRGSAALSIFMPDWENEEFYSRVSKGGLLPQKSTFFYPKVPSGVALFEP